MSIPPSIPPELQGAALPPLSPDAPTPTPNPAEVLKKQVYIGFGSIMAVGLAMTALYIGGRLFAHTSVRAAAPIVAKAAPDVPKPAPVVAKAPVVVAKAAPQMAAVHATPRPEVKPDALPTEQASAAQLPRTPAPAPKLITPQPRERYLQLAALGPSYTEKYLPQLRAQGFNPVVAPGPTDGIYRIIIGPFADQLALEKQRDVLEAAGIESMVRVY